MIGDFVLVEAKEMEGSFCIRRTFQSVIVSALLEKTMFSTRPHSLSIVLSQTCFETYIRTPKEGC
jgi:hypothetical protein